MVAPRALVGDVVLSLRHKQHEHLRAVAAPAPERAVRAVHKNALELGRGLLSPCLGRVALDAPVDDEAVHVHLLFDAEVQAELGLHVMSSRLVRRGTEGDRSVLGRGDGAPNIARRGVAVMKGARWFQPTSACFRQVDRNELRQLASNISLESMSLAAPRERVSCSPWLK